jgi:adenylyl- and sulfurtransferase ThiI
MPDFEDNRSEINITSERSDIYTYYTQIFSTLFRQLEFTNLLVRYSELGTKSQEFRGRMESEIVNGIILVLKRHDIEPTRHFTESGRIYFSFRKRDMKLGSFLILNIPGIDSVSPVLKTDTQIEHIVKRAIEYYSSFMNFDLSIDIKVRLVQQQKKGYINQENQRKIISNCVGAIKKEINQLKTKSPETSRNGSKVLLPEQTQQTIYVEIRDEFSYIYSEKIRALRPGLPIDDRKSSVATYLGRISDISAMERIIRRGVHVLPVLFSTKENVIQDGTLQFIQNFQSFYPINTFYVIWLNLEPILNDIQSKLDSENRHYICSLCRYLRFTILDTLCSDTNNPIEKLLNPAQHGDFASNLAFIMRVERNMDENNKKKQNLYYRQQKQSVSQLTIRKFRGIIDGESWDQNNIYCSVSPELWSTTIKITQPLIQPNLIIESSEILTPIESTFKSIHILTELTNDRQKFENEGENSSKDISNIKYDLQIEQLEKHDYQELLQNKICSYKRELTDFDLRKFKKILESIEPDKLVSRIFQDMKLVKIF